MKIVEPNDLIPRMIGRYSTGHEGPLLLMFGGVHGNEPSGIKALQNVFKELENTKPDIAGTVVGIVGNRQALKQNSRFIDEDLNRVWTKENIAYPSATYEQKEMLAIIDVIEHLDREINYTKRYFMDCHTTSAPTLPFISVQEVNRNDAWAHRFPTYIIRGFSDIVNGCIDQYLSRQGITGFVFEAGQHESEASVENHEGMIWLAMQEACQLDLKKITNYPDCVDKFLKKNSPGQKTFEILYRHEIKEEDTFKMKPGFENFQKIRVGELLAHQNGKELRSRWDAYIHMPLYQEQGSDGFFIIKEVEG